MELELIYTGKAKLSSLGSKVCLKEKVEIYFLKKVAHFKNFYLFFVEVQIVVAVNDIGSVIAFQIIFQFLVNLANV